MATIQRTEGNVHLSYPEKYDTFFPKSLSGKSEAPDWSTFSSSEEELKPLIAGGTPDFEVTTVRTASFFATAQKLFWSSIGALITLPQTIVRKIILAPLYPAQSTIMSYFITPHCTRESVSQQRLAAAYALRDRFYVRHLVFKVNGSLYSGLLAGNKQTIDNGKWILAAPGNGVPVEYALPTFARKYGEAGYNVLMLNSPQVGASRGEFTIKTVKAVQEAGILFLEHVIKAQKIGVNGYSFGGCAVAAAIEKHQFLSDRHYFVIRQMTFDSVSNVCGGVVQRIISNTTVIALVKGLTRWCGLEYDTTVASRKLQEKKIKEIVVQASVGGRYNKLSADHFIDDNVIPPEASLGYRLVTDGITEHKIFVHVRYDHNFVEPVVAATVPYLAEV